jgi:hypothetical protein
VSALVIPSLCESPVSVAADSANAVGAGVDAGTVVVVVGATVVVVGATVVVGGATVVVGGATVVVGGATVVVGGATVVVGGTVVGGTVVVGEAVAGGAVFTDCDGVVAPDVVGVGPAPNGATVEAGTTGGAYLQPDNAIVREILIVEMTFAPLFTRS